MSRFNPKFLKKAIKLYLVAWIGMLQARLRFFRRLRFRIFRLLIFLFFRTWVKAVHGYKNLPERGPALIVSNHLSYYDFLIIGSFLARPAVFIASAHLKEHPFVSWFSKFDTLVYIDRENPGYRFFREIMLQLRLGKIVVIYPEGMRSRTGKMLKPKTGFIKLALKANAAIIPVGMKGTFDILPPHKKFPSLKRCEVFIGKRFFISPQVELFGDLFKHSRKKFEAMSDDQMQVAANRIMNLIRENIGEDWENSEGIDLQGANLAAEKI